MGKGHYISSYLAAVHSPKCGCPECSDLGGLFDDITSAVSSATASVSDLFSSSDAEAPLDPEGQSLAPPTVVNTSTSTSAPAPTPSRARSAPAKAAPVTPPPAISGSTINVGMVAGIAAVAGALYFLTKKK